MTNVSIKDLVFENVWQKPDAQVHAQAIAIWKQSPALRNTDLAARAQQLVYVVKNKSGEVIGMTTAYKAYVKQFRNFFYLFRCLIMHDAGIPGLETKITILTRDFLESIYKTEPEQVIGLMAIVQNPNLVAIRHAVWPMTKFAYVGTTSEGHPIRVYYFDKVNIKLQP